MSLSRLLVEAGFAAVSHGLRVEMRSILAALPDFIDEPQQLARTEAILLLGLGRTNAVKSRLAMLDAHDRGILHVLLEQSQ